MTRYTVLVPCHNEEGALASVLAGVRAALPDAQLIVVDDGSTDRTAQIAAATEGVQLLTMDVNAGKGAALRKAFPVARGASLVFIDGDGQDDPADLAAMCAAAENGARFVNGSKFIGRIERGGISRPNYWGNRFMSGLISLLFGARVTDSQSGFRIIERAVVEQMTLRADEYEIETEMLCQALKAGVAVTELPVTRKARLAGATGFKRVRNGLRILATIVRQRFTR
ncbi:MAG TPA: glycosyltransferase family 2 protein [bacterium]|nr:glycosyltransferase family 2 protein [bacterium]